MANHRVDIEAVEGIELVDYPAVALPETQKKIDSFLAACASIRAAHKDDQRRARIALASRHADQLISRRNELEAMLWDGDLWLSQHPDKDDEDRWICWDQEYRAIWDALNEGAKVAFGDVPVPAQSRMLGMTA